MISGKQIRYGRVLVRMSQEKLADQAGKSVLTLWRVEQAEGEPMIMAATADAIQRALESAGVEFTNGEQPGVRIAHAIGKATYNFIGWLTI